MANLEAFQLSGVTETGVEIGRGSYAVVVELRFRGLKCAGKKLHRQLCHESSRAERDSVLRRFEEECELLSALRHPNVVQFLGVYASGAASEPLPVLVMEFLQSTLSGCLERRGRLPDEVSYGVLADVATGLCYLHGSSPAIIHRDLSANNVLLSGDMHAKISDLGVSRILGLTPAQMTQMTTCPGTPSYMPPEALSHSPVYTTTIDTFSCGVLILHTFTGQWPLPMEATRVSTTNPEKVDALTEVERRQPFLDVMGEEHPLMGLVKQCLSNHPASRPSAGEIHRQVCAIALQVPSTFENRLDFLAQYKLGTAERETLKSEISQSKRTAEIAQTDLKSESEERKVKIAELEAEKKSLSGQLHAAERALQAKHSECATRLEVNESRFKAREAALKTEYEVQSQQLSISLQAKEQELAEKRKEVSTLEQAMERLLQSKEEEVEARRSETACKVELLEKKEETISDLHSQLAQLREAKATCSQGQLQLKYTECPGLPMAMGGSQCLLLNGVVYVGGGVTDDEYSRFAVLQYDPKSNEWSSLPNCPVKYFGLAHYRGKLHTVGGTSDHDTVTNELYTLQSDPCKWKKSQVIPHMPTRRYFVTAVTHGACVAVCGGLDHTRNSLATVEVFRGDLSPSQWLSVSPLPFPCLNMKAAVVGSKCYLMGGFMKSRVPSRSLLSISLDELFAPPSSSASPRLSTGQVIAECPYNRSAIAGLGGVLLAIGGHRSDSRMSVTNEVYAFSEVSHTWTKLGPFPAEHCSSSAVTLAGGEVVLLGGVGGAQKRLWNVWTLSLQL